MEGDFSVTPSAHLLLGQLLLDLLVVAHAVGDGPRQLGLDATQPGAQVTHVLVQLLHRHQGLLQLLHPDIHPFMGKKMTIKIEMKVVETVSSWLVSSW